MDKNQSIKDFQLNQKHIGQNYYNFSTECANPNLRNDFLSFAREESDIITWLDYEYDENAKPTTEYISLALREDAFHHYNNA